MTSGEFEKWRSQARKGFLPLAVLQLLLVKQTSYGFEMLEIMHNNGYPITEGTLYPMLNRMDQAGWLSSHWQTPTEDGTNRPRRFYSITPCGCSLLSEMQQEFAQQRTALIRLAHP